MILENARVEIKRAFVIDHPGFIVGARSRRGPNGFPMPESPDARHFLFRINPNQSFSYARTGAGRPPDFRNR